MPSELPEDIQPYGPQLNRIARAINESVRKASESQAKGIEMLDEFKDRQNRDRAVQIGSYKALLMMILKEPDFFIDGITATRNGNSCVVTISQAVSLAVRTVPRGKDLASLVNHGRARIEGINKVFGEVLFGTPIRELALCVELHSTRDRYDVKAVGVTRLENGEPCWEDVVLLDHRLEDEAVVHEDDFAETVNKMKLSDSEEAKEGGDKEDGGESVSFPA